MNKKESQKKIINALQFKIIWVWIAFTVIVGAGIVFIGIKRQEKNEHFLIKYGKKTTGRLSRESRGGKVGSTTTYYYMYVVNDITYECPSHLSTNKKMPIVISYNEKEPEDCLLLPFEIVEYKGESFWWRKSGGSYYYLEQVFKKK